MAQGGDDSSGARRTDAALGPSGGVHKAVAKGSVLQAAAKAARSAASQMGGAKVAMKAEEDAMELNLSYGHSGDDEQRPGASASSDDMDLEKPDTIASKSLPATVSFKYSNLPRESKEKVQELLFTWLEWHRANIGPEGVNGAELLSGEIEVSTSLQGAAGERVWMDKPRASEPSAEPSTKSYEAQYGSLHKVPLYDRGCNFLSSYSPTPGQGNEPKAMNRCFNCGSYFHGIQKCTQPMNFAKIAENKAASGFVAGGGGGWGQNQRYFEEGSTDVFKGLQPGTLSAETREALGISEHSPPPWFQRMRVLGPPPGWKDGLRQAGEEALGDDTFVIDDGDGNEQRIVLPDNSTKGTPVVFPGISAPAPGEQDPGAREWASELANQPSGIDHEFRAKYASMTSSQDRSSVSGASHQHMAGQAPPAQAVVSPPPHLPPPHQHNGFYQTQYNQGQHHLMMGSGMFQHGQRGPSMLGTDRNLQHAYSMPHQAHPRRFF